MLDQKEIERLCGEMSKWEGIEEFKNIPEDKVVSEYHHTTGRYIRNKWLWDRTSYTHTYFNSIGIWHPDDMSSILLLSLHRILHGKNMQLEEQVRGYKEFWEKNKEN